MIKKSPTFQYWDTILTIEIYILVFVSSSGKEFFFVCGGTGKIVGFFFAFDHYNYARWVSVHIRDMSSIPSSIKQDFINNWVVLKSQHRFSSIPIDQALNAVVKGKGGVIGLTENPVTLQRWLLCGPELARCIFEILSMKEVVHLALKSCFTMRKTLLLKNTSSSKLILCWI